MKTMINHGKEMGLMQPEAYPLKRVLARTAVKMDDFVALLAPFLVSCHPRRRV